MKYKKLFKTKLFKNLRNFLGIRPAHFLIDYEKKNLSVSDAFFWRTDNSFKTVFKFSNILNLFLKDITSQVEILFYCKNSKLIKKLELENIDISNQIIIDKLFLNGLEDYGTFYIYHKSNNFPDGSIRNSCYTGYSYKNNLASFVHGNTLTSLKSYDGKISQKFIGGRSFFRNQVYNVQNNYKLGRTEILLMNPCDKTLKVELNGENFLLKKGYSKLLEINSSRMIKIKSKSYLLRPVVFNYRENYLDVHHG